MPRAGFSARRKENLTPALPTIANVDIAVSLVPGSPTTEEREIKTHASPSLQRKPSPLSESPWRCRANLRGNRVADVLQYAAMYRADDVIGIEHPVAFWA